MQALNKDYLRRIRIRFIAPIILLVATGTSLQAGAFDWPNVQDVLEKGIEEGTKIAKEAAVVVAPVATVAYNAISEHSNNGQLFSNPIEAHFFFYRQAIEANSAYEDVIFSGNDLIQDGLQLRGGDLGKTLDFIVKEATLPNRAVSLGGTMVGTYLGTCEGAVKLAASHMRRVRDRHRSTFMPLSPDMKQWLSRAVDQETLNRVRVGRANPADLDLPGVLSFQETAITIDNT